MMFLPQNSFSAHSALKNEMDILDFNLIESGIAVNAGDKSKVIERLQVILKELGNG